MKVQYFPENDMLYVALADRASEEIGKGVVADLDAQGTIVGLEVENASRLLDLRELQADVGRERLALPRFIPTAVAGSTGTSRDTPAQPGE